MRRLLILNVIAILVLMMALAGCSGSKTGGTADESPITIALSPWPGWFFWFLTEEKGFFEKHGVEVELKWFNVYSDSLQAIATGQVDANSQTLSDTLAPLSKDIGLKAVLINDNSNGGDAVVASEGIDTVKDLSGKTIAAEMGTVIHLLLLTALAENGMSESDVNFVNMTVNDSGPAFISGRVDAASLWEPFQTIAVQEGKGKVLFSSKDTPGLIPDLLVFREEVIENRPDDVQAIINAWFDTLAYFEANQEESIALMAEKAETSVEDFALGLESIKIFTLEDNLNAFKEADNYESLVFTGDKTAEFLLKLDMISSLPDITQLLEPKFLQNLADQ